MKYLFLVLLSVVLISFELISSVGATDSMLKEALGKSYIEERDTFSYNGEKIQYMLIFPAKYFRIVDRWPMIFFLHGGSGRGQNLEVRGCAKGL